MTCPTGMRIALYARVSTSKCEKCGKRQTDHVALDHEYWARTPKSDSANCANTSSCADGKSPKSIPIASRGRKTLGRDWTS